MKKLFLSALLFVCASLSADPIDSYQKLTSALRQGKQLVIVLDLERCIGKPGMPTGYFVPNAMMLVPGNESKQEHVATSLLHFTDRTGKPTYEYVKYTFFADGSVEVQTSVYDPQDWSLQGPVRVFTTFMDHGISVKASNPPTRDLAPGWLLRPH